MPLLSELTGQLSNTFLNSTQAALEAANLKISSLKADQALADQTITTLQTAMVSQTIADEGDLGTLTWSGTAPSGAITKRYRWSQTGRVVTIDWLVKASTPGLLVSALSVALPTGAPAPSPLSNVVNDSWAVMGAGQIAAGVSVNTLSGQAGLYKNANGSYALKVTTSASLAASMAQGHVQYLTA